MVEAKGARTSRQEQVEQRRAELLEAAKQVVLERGLSQTRVADVAAATRVSGGLIHYHFATKDVLLTEMLRHEAERDIAKARRLATGSGNTLQRLDRVMREFVPGSRNDQTWVLWIDAWGASLRDETLRT
ncbi:MAG: TetR family transcriptional regulator, partial [Actinomycetes bacterium]